MIGYFVDWCTQNRNRLFIAVCIAVHAIYAAFFAIKDVNLLSLLNLVSTFFYINLFIQKDFSEKKMVNCYFEILLFSFLSDLALGSGFGFYLFTIAMISTVFYLVPSYGNKRFMLQIIGGIVLFAQEFLAEGLGIYYGKARTPMEAYQGTVHVINLLIFFFTMLLVTFLYSNEAERARGILSYNVNHDTLTKLYNRRYFETQLNAIPYDKRHDYVISMLDIDDFKKVNDTYGHDAGDMVLVQVASILQEAAGQENMAVRWGGEEFILYFPYISAEDVAGIMENVRKNVQSAVIRTQGKEIRVTITIGISMGRADSNYEKVIRSADEKLYLGKRRGKNCIIT